MLVEYPLNVFPLHFFHRWRLLAQFRRCCQRLKTTHELMNGNRLTQVVDRPAAHSFNSCSNAAVACKHQNFEARLFGKEFRQELEAALACKVQVQNTLPEDLRVQDAECFGMGVGACGFDTLAFQGTLKYFQEGSVIVNKQPAVVSSHLLPPKSALTGPASGKSMIMVVPCWSTRALRVPPKR